MSKLNLLDFNALKALSTLLYSHCCNQFGYTRRPDLCKTYRIDVGRFLLVLASVEPTASLAFRPVSGPPAEGGTLAEPHCVRTQ